MNTSLGRALLVAPTATALTFCGFTGAFAMDPTSTTALTATPVSTGSTFPQPAAAPAAGPGENADLPGTGAQGKDGVAVPEHTDNNGTGTQGNGGQGSDGAVPGNGHNGNGTQGNGGQGSDGAVPGNGHNGNGTQVSDGTAVLEDTDDNGGTVPDDGGTVPEHTDNSSGDDGQLLATPVVQEPTPGDALPAPAPAPEAPSLDAPVPGSPVWRPLGVVGVPGAAVVPTGQDSAARSGAGHALAIPSAPVAASPEVPAVAGPVAFTVAADQPEAQFSSAAAPVSTSALPESLAETGVGSDVLGAGGLGALLLTLGAVMRRRRS